MNRISMNENKLLAKKAVAYLYSLVIMAIAFFAGWTFFSLLKVVVGLNTNVYWLSKALIQQVSFIIVMMILCVLYFLSAYMFETAMIKKDTWFPKSFIFFAAGLGLFYAICKIIVITY